MDILPLLCIVSVALTGLTKGDGVLPDGPLNEAVGKTVIFSTTLTPPVKTFLIVAWTVTINNTERLIITSTSSNIIEPEYEDRITLYRSTGSLVLRNLTLSDSGVYRVSIISDGGRPITGSTELKTFVPVSNITVNANSTDLVEFNSSVSLFCFSIGSSLSFHWLNGSSEIIPSERVQLPSGYSTLKMSHVTRYHQGPYTCKVSNAVSEGISDPINLSISFGPENIALSPTQEYYVEGSNISLSCSAASRPPAQFHWFLNGDKLSDTGPELTLINIQESQSGKYSCQAFNNKTLRYQTSQPSTVTVVAPVSNVKVNASSTDLVEFNSSVILLCYSSGSSLSFLWLNGSSEIIPSERVQLPSGYSTLRISHVTRYDQGPYSCKVSNAVSEGTSDPINLSISFGPENIALSPTQEYYVEGSDISLSCSAASRPPAQFHWFLNGDKLSDTGPELTLINIQESQSGNYSCQAFNNKTLRYQTSQPSAINVQAPVSNVILEVSSTDLVEFNSSVILMCFSVGSSLSFLWLNGSSEIIPSERVQLPSGYSTLRISPVTRYDQGPYSCKVSNAVSEGTSDPINLSISFGPEKITLTLSPTQEYYVEGSDISLSCSAASRPPARIHWFLNGDKLSDTGPELTLINIQESQSGNYSCQAFNNKTSRYQTSQHSAINVLAPVSNVILEVSSTDLVEFNSSVILLCYSSGSSLSFLWLNGSSEIIPSERVQLPSGYSTLRISHVTRYDQGPYSCKVSNAVSEGTSDPINLSISFGPENIALSPTQEYYVEGSNISLSCSAASRPPAQFHWFLNGDKLSDTGPELTLINIQESQSGNYSCQAFNNKTLRYQTSQPSTVTVMAPVSNVILEVSRTDLVEFNSSVILMCFSVGSSLSFLWLNGSSEITANERLQLPSGYSTLYIASVTRYDQGPYSCKVSNDISEGTSDPVNLSISFGPENIALSPTQEYYVEGSNISLSCSAASRPPAQFHWFLNGDKLSDTGPELTLINIQESQSGNYSCQAFNNKTLRYQTSQHSTVTVLVPVSNVKVEVSSTDLVELSSSVILSCSSSGSFLSFLWLNGSSEVIPSERVQLIDGNSTLKISHVTRYHQGPYSCKVSNDINEGTSDPINLSISFGPENIALSPTQEYYVEGSDIILSCSAASRPPARIHWFLNGEKLSDTGPELTLINIQESQSGNYSCQAFNNKTSRYQTSQHSAINVVVPVSNVKVNVSNIDLMEFNSSVSLSCSCFGSSLSLFWLNSSSEVTANERVQLTDGGHTLIIFSVTRYDQGPYSCKVSNVASEGTSDPINLSINYGPEDVQITGPSEINVGETLNLNCSAACTPSASYTWLLDGIEILNNSAVFTKDMIELSESGNYTCQALNNKTGRTSSAEHQVSVTEETSVCGADCITGSVVACCAVVGGAVGGGFYFFKKQMEQISNGLTSSGTGDEGFDNIAFSGDQELKCADTSSPQNLDDGTVVQELQNNTEYAQIQRNTDPAAALSLPSYDEHIQRMKTALSQYGANGAQVFTQVQETDISRI